LKVAGGKLISVSQPDVLPIFIVNWLKGAFTLIARVDAERFRAPGLS
jgi:hypothetical protein